MTQEISRRLVNGVWETIAAEAGGAGSPFNGGTITENLVVDTASGPQLTVDGAASGDFDDLWSFKADGSTRFRGTTDGGGEWDFREDGSVLSFLKQGGDNPGTIMAIREYDVKVRKDTASGGGNLLLISRESGGGIGFFGAAATAQPTGVAVTAEAIHAALVTLGLIAGP